MQWTLPPNRKAKPRKGYDSHNGDLYQSQCRCSHLSWFSEISVSEVVRKEKEEWLKQHFAHFSFISRVFSWSVCALCLQAEQLMKRIGVEGVKLTEYEMNIASHLVDPQTMKVTAVIFHPWWSVYSVSWHVNVLFFTIIFHRQTFSWYSTSLQVSWRDIAGLDEVINELQDTVILPIQKRHLLAGSKLFQPPKGTTFDES